jgi:hypothetical protein
MKYISPLNCYIVWHPEFKDGEKFANEIYSLICRDSNNPLQRGMGIPVFYRSEPGDGIDVPITINVKEAKRNALIILVDDEMFNDSKWEDYISSLIELQDESTRIYPVAFSEYAYSQNEGQLNLNQFI